MKLPTRARYAVHLMLAVARRPDAPTSLREVAERTGISRRCLDQLAISLRTANLVRGQSGRAGGYHLARSAGRISIGAIVEAAMGPVNIVECVRHPETCLESEACEWRAVYAAINERFRDLLEGMSLADFAEAGPGRMRGAPAPNGTSRLTSSCVGSTPLPHGEIGAGAGVASLAGEASFLTGQLGAGGKSPSSEDLRGERRWHPACPHRRERLQGRWGGSG